MASKVMQEMHMEEGDRPEEMLADGSALYTFDQQHDKIKQKLSDKANYEESHFVRLQQSKKDKNMHKKAAPTLKNELKDLKKEFKMFNEQE